MKPLWIELVNGGVANRFNFKDHELIEINWRLNEEPELYQRILNHELEHKSGGYRFGDLWHDFKSRTPGLHKFMFKNPSTWSQLLPIYWSKRHKQIVYDISSMFSYGIMAFVLLFTYYILGVII